MGRYTLEELASALQSNPVHDISQYSEEEKVVMESARNAISSFLGRDGAHKTDVDEVYVEAVW